MTGLHVADWPWSVQMDCLGFLLGEYLGSGDSRHVWVFQPDPKLVIKVHHSTLECHFTNQAEWDIWHNMKDFKHVRKWLAPCVNISPSGHVLLMKKVDPLPKGFKLPKKVPNVLADLGKRNWGMYKGRPVMCDYGNHRFFSEAKKYFRMVPPRKGPETSI